MTERVDALEARLGRVETGMEDLKQTLLAEMIVFGVLISGVRHEVKMILLRDSTNFDCPPRRSSFCPSSTRISLLGLLVLKLTLKFNVSLRRGVSNLLS